MSFFTWQDKFSVGVETFDRDHKILVDLIDQLHEAFVTGNVRETVEQVLTVLIDYTETHFAREEALMVEMGYPASREHIAQHQELKQQVIDILTRFRSDPNASMGNEVLGFLHNWLTLHILETDMSYKSFFIEHGTGSLQSNP
ncbi:MAG: hemerythrin family protein [Alphaproteobacteria bacterium]|nr:hemerythrin family protein [Alphaproteobacteria bacterium]MBF0393234.1 hemerythrin family protein [Alphaproteobacteria bacterium]